MKGDGCRLLRAVAIRRADRGGNWGSASRLVSESQVLGVGTERASWLRCFSYGHSRVGNENGSQAGRGSDMVSHLRRLSTEAGMYKFAVQASMAMLKGIRVHLGI